MHPIGGAVIAAAGLGSRLGHGLPKCLVEVEGVPILTRLITALEAHVERIHVVAGYREELVIEFCAIHHRDVIVVRNPDFRTTSTGQSLLLGARGLDGRALFVDGDIVLRASGLDQIVESSTHYETVLGVTKSATDDGVTVDLSGSLDDQATVTGFTRQGGQPFEWANIMACPPSILGTGEGYVFERLRTQLPLAAAYVEMAEVDTSDDLVRASAFVRGWR